MGSDVEVSTEYRVVSECEAATPENVANVVVKVVRRCQTSIMIEIDSAE